MRPYLYAICISRGTEITPVLITTAQPSFGDAIRDIGYIHTSREGIDDLIMDGHHTYDPKFWVTHFLNMAEEFDVHIFRQLVDRSWEVIPPTLWERLA